MVVKIYPVPVDNIDAVLPQTQCGLCSYPGCKPYATAIAAGEADINQCPPGGQEGVDKLAALLGVPSKPLAEEARPKRLAVIDEANCIGCTLCLQACPVDAIAGAAKLMHTVIAAECTGCELCIAPCPTECIDMVDPPAELMDYRPDHARARFEFRNERLERDKRERAERLAAKAAEVRPEGEGAASSGGGLDAAKQAVIAAAMARAKQQLDNLNSAPPAPKTGKPDEQ